MVSLESGGFKLRIIVIGRNLILRLFWNNRNRLLNARKTVN
jgi:hypothetical protein